MIRVGQGYDVHRFKDGGDVILGGVKIPYEQGLEAHSDGDVVLHALCDAILGAAALGDIGKHFPDTDPEFKGADSRVLLRHVYGIVQEKGYRLVNADITIIARRRLCRRTPPRCAAISPMICMLTLISLTSKRPLRRSWALRGAKKALPCRRLS